MGRGAGSARGAGEARGAGQAGRPKLRQLMLDIIDYHSTPEQAAQELTAAGADVIGANCGQGIGGFLPLCQRLRAATDRPIWMKPNAGLPQLVEGRAVYVGTPEDFAGHIPALLKAGANFVGGCCGTSPQFISAVCHRLAV